MTEADRLKYEIAFKNTAYIVKAGEWNTKDVVIRIGEIPEELFTAIPNLKTWGFITAWNPLPETLSIEENTSRNNSLEKVIKAMGLRSIKGVGKAMNDPWEEESFCIVNISLELLRGLAKENGQLAFVYGEKSQPAQLVFTAV